MTIVRSIYNAPWQIAFVRDTLRDKEGVFYGPEGTRLDGWLELVTDQLDFIIAANLYGQLAEASPAARADLLAQLRDLVTHSTDMGHWRRHGRYQDVALDEAAADLETMPVAQPQPTDLPTETLGVEHLINIYQSQAAPPLADPEVEQGTAQRELERAISLLEREDVPGALEILRRLAESHADLPGLQARLDLVEEMEKREAAQRELERAKSLIKSGNIQSGLQMLRHLAETYPDLPGLQEAIADGEEREQQAQQRRPGLPSDL